MADAEIRTLLDVFVDGVTINGKTFGTDAITIGTVTIPATSQNLHLWDGLGELTIQVMGRAGSTTYTGAGYALELSPIENKAGLPDKRVSVTLGIGNDNNRAKAILSQDLGPLRAEIRLIFSTDDGDNWQFIPILRRGRLSNMQFNTDNAALNAELETPRGDILRGVPRFWSHETQQDRFPGDMGFEFLSQMQEGFESTFPFGFEPELSVRRAAGNSSSTSANPFGGGFAPPVGFGGYGR